MKAKAASTAPSPTRTASSGVRAGVEPASTPTPPMAPIFAASPRRRCRPPARCSSAPATRDSSSPRPMSTWMRPPAPPIPSMAAPSSSTSASADAQSRGLYWAADDGRQSALGNLSFSCDCRSPTPACRFLSIPLPNAPQPLDCNRNEDEGADEAALPERTDAEQDQAVADHLDQGGADHGTERRARAAGQVRAADHCGGDHGQFHALAEVGGDAAEPADLKDARDPGGEGGEHVDRHLHAGDADAGHARGFLVAADGEEMPAPPGPAEGKSGC